jgi:hypothetical protein
MQDGDRHKPSPRRGLGARETNRCPKSLEVLRHVRARHRILTCFENPGMDQGQLDRNPLPGAVVPYTGDSSLQQREQDVSPEGASERQLSGWTLRGCRCQPDYSKVLVHLQAGVVGQTILKQLGKGRPIFPLESPHLSFGQGQPPFDPSQQQWSAKFVIIIPSPL